MINAKIILFAFVSDENRHLIVYCYIELDVHVHVQYMYVYNGLYIYVDVQGSILLGTKCIKALNSICVCKCIANKHFCLTPSTYSSYLMP